MDITTLLLLFPIIFMLHEFEEIIFLKLWWRHNKHNQPASPFTASAQRPLSTFALTVAEEFILFSAILLIAVATHYPLLAFGLICGVGLHLVWHVVEAIHLRRYMPSVITSVATLPYYILVAIAAMQTTNITFWQLLCATIILGAVGIANLIGMNKISAKIAPLFAEQ